MEFRVVPLSGNSEATGEGREPQELIWEELGEDREEAEARDYSFLGPKIGIAITNP